MTYEPLCGPCRSLLSRGHLAMMLTTVLALGASAAPAGIIGINTPTSSVASIIFNDTNSIGPRRESPIPGRRSLPGTVASSHCR